MNNLTADQAEQSSEANFQDYDLLCFSHLRWDFVYQRPQHLMSRFALQRRVYFIEEPMIVEEPTHLAVNYRQDNLCVVVPHLNRRETESRTFDVLMREQIGQLLAQNNIDDYVTWYYTPMALNFTAGLKPKAVVYDCMDELSMFRFAPPELIANEAKLFGLASIVFTGGQSLYEAKRRNHPNVWAFPSSIDTAHFNQARKIVEEPADQMKIAKPRLGYVGVIDERIDIDLIRELAEKRPEWQIVMIGPVVKIDENDLPRLPNIHYLGMKNYQELPAYIAGWEVALMPFALNDSTKFISPTKTPEYLAAGKPVVSTAIRDVVRPYGEQNLVSIASSSDEFIRAAEKSMSEEKADFLPRVDKFLRQTSWDKTWQRMSELIDESIRENHSFAARKRA